MWQGNSPSSASPIYRLLARISEPDLSKAMIRQLADDWEVVSENTQRLVIKF